MNTKRTGAILVAAALLLSAVAPTAVTAQSASLSVDVSQDETGSVTITVADNGTAVENATVNVTAADNDTYADAGEYETGPNGTVTLSAPAEPVTVSVEAEHDGANATTTADLEPALGLSVEGAEDGSVLVTVTRGTATVENATVNVTANATYADAGEYETGPNGTVTLANPSDPVELTITATEDGDTASTTVLVEPVQTLGVGVEQAEDGTVTVSVGRLGDPVENATVSVTAEGNGTYAGAGEYETDGTGTVVLPAPADAVTVTVTATHDGETATTTADLAPPEPRGPFGQVVSAFVSALKGAGFTGIGQQVSDFVTSNNPSNDAGNSEAVTPPAAGNDAPVTPPGQEKKGQGEKPRVVPASPPVEDPGNSGSAPGQSDDGDDDAPGNSGSAPGQSDDGDDADDDDAPGNSGSAPGQSDDGDDADDDDAPGNSGSAPGQSDDGDDDADDGEAEDDDADDAPGNSGSAPGQSDDGDDADDDDGNGNAGGNGGGNGNAGGNGNGR